MKFKGNILKWNLFGLFALLVITANAQVNHTLYNMHTIPQSCFLNPAIQGPCKVWVGMPVLSSIHLDAGNTFASFNSATYKEDSSFYPDVDIILRKMHKIDFITTELHLNLIALGYRYKDYYFTFTVTEKNNTITSFPHDLISFVWEGNSSEVGQTIHMNRLGVNMMHYREFGLGVSKRFDDALTIGLRGKLLFGKAHLQTKRMQLELTTLDRTRDWDIHSELLINASAPITLATDQNGIITDAQLNDPLDIRQLILNRQNPGFALDGGFLYDVNEKLTLSGSFIDLGFIRWRSDVHNISESYDYTYEGINLDSIDFDLVEYARGLLDTVINNFRLENTNDPYTTLLPLRLHAGATYKLTRKTNVGFMHGYRIYKWRFIPSATLSLNTRPVKWLSTSVSWSYHNYTLNNLGLGFGLQSRNFQYYMVSDNVSGLIWPQTTRGVNLRFGFNFFFGCKNTPKEEDVCMECPGCQWLRTEVKKDYQRNQFLGGKKKKSKKK